MEPVGKEPSVWCAAGAQWRPTRVWMPKRSSSANDFYSQPQVANGASNLLVSLFGEDAGAPTRSAVGMNVLPGNIPVEIEAIFKIK